MLARERLEKTVPRPDSLRKSACHAHHSACGFEHIAPCSRIGIDKYEVAGLTQNHRPCRVTSIVSTFRIGGACAANIRPAKNTCRTPKGSISIGDASR